MYGMLEFCLSMRGEYSTRLKIINCIFFKVKETNGDWIKCSEENNRELNSCYDNCEFNPDCAAGCNRDFSTRQLECPCEVRVTLWNQIFRWTKQTILQVHVNLLLLFKENCLGGCPCDKYSCVETTTTTTTATTTTTNTTTTTTTTTTKTITPTPNAVLVLTIPSYRPMLIDFDGNNHLFIIWPKAKIRFILD